jgi:hypothetical protein
VEHEVLAGALGQRIDGLSVSGTPQRGVDERLRLAAREECRTVGAWHRTNLAGDRTDILRAATVDADAVAQNALAHQLGSQVVKTSLHSSEDPAELRLALLERLQRVEDDLLLAELVAVRRDHVLLDIRDGGVALGLDGDRHRLAKARLGRISH